MTPAEKRLSQAVLSIMEDTVEEAWDEFIDHHDFHEQGAFKSFLIRWLHKKRLNHDSPSH